MTLNEWWAITPRREINKLAWRLLKLKNYQPFWNEPDYKLKVMASRRVRDYVVLLCEIKSPGHVDKEYVVFTDLLKPKSVPSDKFCGDLRGGINSYLETCIKLGAWNEQ